MPARAYPGRTSSRTMPSRSASGSAASRAASAGSTWAPSSGAGSAMIGGYAVLLLSPAPGMTPRSFLLTPELAEHVRASSEPLDDVASDLVAETAALAERGEAPATFQIAVEQGVLMQLLTRALGVRRAVEIGTFTGFSALCIARGLTEDGSLLCLDRSAEWTAVARRYWVRAGVADRVELRLGEALEQPPALPAEPVCDLAFLDA